MDKVEFTLSPINKIKENFQNLLIELKNEKDPIIINKRISKCTGGHCLFTLDLNVINYNIELYRVTKLYEGLDNNIENSASFSCPPSEKTNIGRSNLEGFPVFYGSISAKTAIDEVNLELDETFYISKWKFQKNKSLNTFILANDSIDRGGVFDNKIDECLELITSNFSEENKSRFKETQKRFIDLFTHNGSEYYNISASIAHQILYFLKDKIVETPVLIYPSVSKKGSEYNFAIHPDFVNDSSCFNLISVVKCKKSKENEGEVLFSKGINNNGKISWGDFKIKLLKANSSEVEIWTSLLLKSQTIKTSDYCVIDDISNFLQ